MKRYCLAVFAVAALAFAWTAHSDAGDATKSEAKVKASFEASKVGADGKQSVTITLATMRSTSQSFRLNWNLSVSFMGASVKDR